MKLLTWIRTRLRGPEAAERATRTQSADKRRNEGKRAAGQMTGHAAFKDSQK